MILCADAIVYWMYFMLSFFYRLSFVSNLQYMPISTSLHSFHPILGNVKGWEFGEGFRMVCANVDEKLYALEGQCPR